MLVLTRKVNEKEPELATILLRHCTGELIRVVLVRAAPGSARIGIGASDEWSIVRAELEQETRNPKPKPEHPAFRKPLESRV